MRYTATVKQKGNDYYVEIKNSPFSNDSLLEWIDNKNGSFDLMEITPDTAKKVLVEFRSELRNLLKNEPYTIEQQEVAEEIWQLLHSVADKYLVSTTIEA